MRRGAVLDRRDHQRQWEVGEALRAQWRMFERVTLRPASDGAGFHATIHLDPIVVKGSAEQQGSHMSPARLRQAEERRTRAITDCVERVNKRLAPPGKIREFEVLVHSA